MKYLINTMSLFIIIFLTSSCSNAVVYNPISSTTEANSSNGTVIAGIAQDGDSFQTIATLFIPVRPNIKMTWSVNTNPPRVLLLSTSFLNPTDVSYQVFNVPPGSYFLTRIDYFVNNRYYTVDYTHSKINFSVKAGEAIYIGNYIITPNVGDGQIPKMRIAKDETAAKNALSEYMNVPGHAQMVTIIPSPPRPM